MMVETSVGIRELKTHLSSYLRRVKAGESVIITEHGRPIGQIVPLPESMKDRLQSMIDAGLVEWSGQKVKTDYPTVVNESDTLLSDIVVEMRE